MEFAWQPTGRACRVRTRTTVGWFGTLLIACYAPVLWGLVRQWASDEDMGHGFLVPLVTGYIVWRQRLELSKVKPARNYWGLALAIWVWV
jgi:hypothetical protein